MTKRVLFLLMLAAAFALVVPTIAMANFAIHGGYTDDTDACAGCHRAHTSVSTITWQDTTAAQESHSALLTSAATRMIDFCYACHDGTSQGADTNVQNGIYEGTLYGSQDTTLAGGGFETVGTTGDPVTSTHIADGASWGAYGGGYFGQGATGADGQDPNANLGETEPIVMDCATCHDPHGSANYRILKDVVFGNTVGGYDSSPPYTEQDPNPTPWVISAEPGFPTIGFLLHEPGAAQVAAYTPNYTNPAYAKAPDRDGNGQPDPDKGFSGWCAGCHATYLGPKTVITKSDGTTYTAFASTYNAGDGYGLALRHKHPVNVPLANFNGVRPLIVASNPLPLEHDGAGDAAAQEATDWIGCQTCHRAHGTSAIMTGWADELSAIPGDDVADFVSRTGGDPSALLRLDNRGVCEVCHNK